MGGYPNRFGKDVCSSLARSFEEPSQGCMIQYLNLNSVSLGTEDLGRIVDGIIKGEYKFIETLELSNNRLQGVECGKVIS